MIWILGQLRLIVWIIWIYVWLRVVWAWVNVALFLRIVLTVVKYWHDSLGYWGIDFVWNVWLDERNYVLQGKALLFGKVLHYWVELKDFTVDVEFCGDVYSFEEIIAERKEVFKVGDLSWPSIPKYALEPLYLGFQFGDISIGLYNLVTMSLYFSDHLH